MIPCVPRCRKLTVGLCLIQMFSVISYKLMTTFLKFLYLLLVWKTEENGGHRRTTNGKLTFKFRMNYWISYFFAFNRG
jgi:hypothetical protein